MTDTANVAAATNPFGNKKPTKKQAAEAAAAETAAPAFPATEPVVVENPAPTTAPPVSAAPAIPMPGGAPMPGASAAGGLPTAGAVPQSNAEPTVAGNGAPLPTGGFNPLGGPSAGDLGDDFVIDLSDVQAGGRDFIGEGRHLMYCTGVTTGFSKAGNRKLVFGYVVASGNYEGKKAQADCAITEAAMWKIDEHTRALGITNDDTKKPTVGEIKAKATGRLVIGEFVPGTYNGKATSDFSRVAPPDEVGIRTGTTIEQARRGEGMVG